MVLRLRRHICHSILGLATIGQHLSASPRCLIRMHHLNASSIHSTTQANPRGGGATVGGASTCTDADRQQQQWSSPPGDFAANATTAPRAFGAKVIDSAPKTQQQPPSARLFCSRPALVCSLSSTSVASSSSYCAPPPAHNGRRHLTTSQPFSSLHRSIPSAHTSFFGQHQRHLTTSTSMHPLECTKSETKQQQQDSLYDTSSESDSAMSSSNLSLPSLSESGHMDFADAISRDCSFLKTGPPAKKVYRIIVEGNIGSGKTTFLKIFAKNCTSMANKPLIVPEPIDLWRNVNGVNIFQLLADDPKRWSFTFQSYVQLTMIKIHEKDPEEGNFKVMERSLFSARYCFVENLVRKGLIDSCEYYVLDSWFKASLPSAPVDLIIYLQSDPNVVYDRIKQRGRPEESGITLDYLTALHDLHEDWLVHKKFPLPAEVLTIDANTPLEQIVSVYEEKTDGILKEHLISA